jgi:hypothetical protein
MRHIHINDKLSEVGVDLSDLNLGDFDYIGEFTAKKNRDQNHQYYKTRGCFFRPNYERGILIYSLITKYNLRTMLEIGFGRGYGTMCAAKAFHDMGVQGRIVSIDPNLDEDFIKNLTQVFPKHWFEMIEFGKGTSQEALPQLSGKFDLIYVDGDHSYEGVKSDWENCKNRFNRFLLFDDYHLPTKNDAGIDCARLIDEIDDDSKELIIMDRRIFVDDLKRTDNEIDYGQVLITRPEGESTGSDTDDYFTSSWTPDDQTSDEDDNLMSYRDEWMDDDEDVNVVFPGSVTMGDLDIALEARAETWPKRDETYHKLMNSLQDFTEDLKNNAKPNSVSPENMNYFSEQTEDPVFIFGNMKSGTSLLLYLLDGHSSLLTLPVDSHVMKHHNATAMKPSKVSIDETRNRWIRKLVSPTGYAPYLLLGKNRSRYQKFTDAYEWATQNLVDEAPFSLFKAACAAFAMAYPHKLSNNGFRVVEKTPENERFFSQISRNFLNASYIHVLRNPIDNAASMKKLSGEAFNIRHVAHSINTGLELALENSTSGDNYMLLKYEDLVNSPEASMKKVTKHIEIRFTKTLLTPTALKIENQSNSMFPSRRVSGEIYSETKEARDNRINDTLTAQEISTVIEICKENAKKLGYDLDN